MTHKNASALAGETSRGQAGAYAEPKAPPYPTPTPPLKQTDKQNSPEKHGKGSEHQSVIGNKTSKVVQNLHTKLKQGGCLLK